MKFFFVFADNRRKAIQIVYHYRSIDKATIKMSDIAKFIADKFNSYQEQKEKEKKEKEKDKEN